jgi:MFS transporter, FHS family, L-fucose permease
MSEATILPAEKREAEVRVARGPRTLLWVMFSSYFLFGMVTNVIGVVIPEVIAEYRLNLVAAGLLAFAFFLAYGLCSIPAGLLVDRLGSKPLVLAGLLLMALGCLGVTFAPSYLFLLAMVFAIGIGVTVLQTVGNPLVQSLDRPENYHRNLTLTIGFCGIGAFAGPFLLSLLLGAGYRWHTLYLTFAGLCLVLVGLVLGSSFPLRGPSGEGFRFDRIASVVRNPLVLAYALGLFFYVGAEVGTASWIVKFFEAVHPVPGGLDSRAGTVFLQKFFPTLPALVVALFWGAQGIGRLLYGAILDRFGPRLILRVYASLTVLSVLIANFGSRPVSAIAFVACGFFTSVLFTLVFSGTIDSFTENQGTISGVLCTAIVGGALVPPLVGWVGERAGMHAAMLVPAAAFGYVLLLAFFGRARYEGSHA